MFSKFKMLRELWIQMKASDPCYNCQVYKYEGCCFVDSYLCDYPDCSILQKYRDGGI